MEKLVEAMFTADNSNAWRPHFKVLNEHCIHIHKEQVMLLAFIPSKNYCYRILNPFAFYSYTGSQNIFFPH